MDEPDGKADFLAKLRPLEASRSRYKALLAEDKECPYLLSKVQSLEAQIAALRKERDASQPVDERHTRKKQILKGINERITAITKKADEITEKHHAAVDAFEKQIDLHREAYAKELEKRGEMEKEIAAISEQLAAEALVKAPAPAAAPAVRALPVEAEGVAALLSKCVATLEREAATGKPAKEGLSPEDAQRTIKEFQDNGAKLQGVLQTIFAVLDLEKQAAADTLQAPPAAAAGAAVAAGIGPSGAIAGAELAVVQQPPAALSTGAAEEPSKDDDDMEADREAKHRRTSGAGGDDKDRERSPRRLSGAEMLQMGGSELQAHRKSGKQTPKAV